MREVRGLREVARGKSGDSEHATVLVADRGDMVTLLVANVTADMTPEEARFIGNQLCEFAALVEGRSNESMVA
jgi:CelD/BcsL family acetyltransferase involved in cellulose biosynthesis